MSGRPLDDINPFGTDHQLVQIKNEIVLSKTSRVIFLPKFKKKSKTFRINQTVV